MKASLTSLACAAVFWSFFLSPTRYEGAVLREVRIRAPCASAVDVLFVGDGYLLEDAENFWADVGRFSERLVSEWPFRWYRDHINIRALFVPSRERGCDECSRMNAVHTLLESSFDSHKGRVLSFKKSEVLEDLLARFGKAEIEVEIVFVMVNTERYGGAGSALPSRTVNGRPLAAPTFAARAPRSFNIALHELGHSLAGLADAYADRGLHEAYPLPENGDLEAPNVTLPGQFDASSYSTRAHTLKWKRFLSLPGARRHSWLHEGGHYRKRGVYRPWKRCRMRNPSDPFCPVCTEEMARVLVAICGERWDAAEYHRRHPLRLWE